MTGLPLQSRPPTPAPASLTFLPKTESESEQALPWTRGIDMLCSDSSREHKQTPEQERVLPSIAVPGIHLSRSCPGNRVAPGGNALSCSGASEPRYQRGSRAAQRPAASGACARGKQSPIRQPQRPLPPGIRGRAAGPAPGSTARPAPHRNGTCARDRGGRRPRSQGSHPPRRPT